MRRARLSRDAKVARVERGEFLRDRGTGLVEGFNGADLYSLAPML